MINYGDADDLSLSYLQFTESTSHLRCDYRARILWFFLTVMVLESCLVKFYQCTSRATSMCAHPPTNRKLANVILSFEPSSTFSVSLLESSKSLADICVLTRSRNLWKDRSHGRRASARKEERQGMISGTIIAVFWLLFLFTVLHQHHRCRHHSSRQTVVQMGVSAWARNANKYWNDSVAHPSISLLSNQSRLLRTSTEKRMRCIDRWRKSIKVSDFSACSNTLWLKERLRDITVIEFNGSHRCWTLV